MMLFGFVGLTAMDVSLCGPAVGAQSVLTFGATDGAVVQMAVPVFTGGELPNTALVTGAGASVTLCVKLIGCGSPPSSPAAVVAPTASPVSAKMQTAGARRRSQGVESMPFPL